MAVVLGAGFGAAPEPSQQEVAKHAELLGMDLAADKDFLWMARYALMAPLPHAWVTRSSAGGALYHNIDTQEVSVENPCDKDYKRAYRLAKARRDTPVRVVTIHGSSLDVETNALAVRVCGSLHGEELIELKIQPSLPLKTFRSVLAQQLGVPPARLQIMMPGGRLLTTDDYSWRGRGLTLSMALDIDNQEVVRQVEEEGVV